MSSYRWDYMEIEGKKVHFAKKDYIKGQPHIDAVLYQAISDWNVSRLEKLTDYLTELCPDTNLMLVAFEVRDWNGDLSPWPAPAPSGDEYFAGNGPDTARWLKNDCIPEISRLMRVPDRTIITEKTPKHYIMGYSLSGLFALWQFYESQYFEGVICCSGSLWIEGWQQYMLTAQGPENSAAYISLGGKEEKTSNPVMCTIGDATRKQYEFFQKDTNILRQKLEWNSGGHFADSEKRLAKGIAWIIEKNDLLHG